tara:strand:- start:2864 stop:4192 length:1329 start_codon:yes stop_codon:yes gene_type:complete
MSNIKYPAYVSKAYLLKLAIPIFISNLVIPLVSIVDTALMGHLSNQSYLAATAIASSVITMVFWSFGFLRMGTVGQVAQSLGKGDYREVVSSLLRSIILALILSFLIIISKPLIISGIIHFFKPSNNILDLVDKYITIRVFSAPAELTIYVLTGFFLGLQKTKISSSLVSVFCLFNILFSIYFVKSLNLNISGVALGTLTAAYLSILIFIFYTHFFIVKKFKIIPRISKNLFNRKKIVKFFNINFDIFIRTILLTFSFLWIQYLSAKLGENYLAVNTILMQFIIISSFFLDAYAYATEGVVGFSLGRKIKKTFLMNVKNSIEISFITSIIISFIFILFAKNFVNLLTDLELIRFLSYSFLFWIVAIPPIASFCYQLDGIFIGTSQTSEMRNAMIVSVLIYIPLSLYLFELIENHGIWLSLMILMLLRSATLQFYFPKILKRF